jgi:CDP-glycerol glycerophosphotransferase (TagB/SpsB family)
MTGLPRNDFILYEESRLPGDYRLILSELRERIAGRRFVLYAPTWREGGESLYAFSPSELARLERVLERHNAALGIRGHSNVRTHAAYADARYSDTILSMNECPDVNLVLRLTDVLITDYSGIYFDFLLLDRPVIHFVYDLQEYRLDRGFLYDIEEVAAGPLAPTFDQLLTELDQTLGGGDADRTRRREMTQRFHLHGRRAGRVVLDRIKQL